MIADIEACLCDSYLDQNGKPANPPLYSRFVGYNRLLSEYHNSPNSFMDGISRVIRYCIAKGYTAEKFLEKLRVADMKNMEYERERYEDMMTRDCADLDDGIPRTLHDYEEDII